MSKLSKLVADPRKFIVDAYRIRWDRSGLQARVAQQQLTNSQSTISSYLESGDVNWAMETAQRAVERMPQFDHRLQPLRLEALLYTDRHALIEEAGRLKRLHSSVAEYHYYFGQAAYYLNRLDEAQEALQSSLFLRPKHADTAYLLADIHRRNGDIEQAWRLLEYTAAQVKRERIWLELANLVQNASDLSRLVSAWGRSPHRGFMRGVREYIAVGALRAKSYSFAKVLMRDNVLLASRRLQVAPIESKRPNYSNRRARQALSDLRATMAQAGIPFFLISGTLLGCIREGDLLGHDKDIDVGVWEDVPRAQLIKTLEDSGAFRIMASRSDSIVRIRHANNIAVDVFYHFRDVEKNDCWHEGIKVRWHNTPFTLAEREFLGEMYSIPEDYELYLEENYGDWQTPRLDFDSAFDTPNVEVAHQDELTVWVYRMLLDSMIKGKGERVRFYRNKLAEFGEPPL